MKIIAWCLMISMLSAIGVLVTNVIVHDDPFKMFYMEDESDNVADIKLTIIANQVQMTVELKSPRTCKVVLKEMEFNDIDLGGFKYTPVCRQVTDKTVKIKFVKITPT